MKQLESLIMRIAEYDDVNPVSVLNLNLLALNFPLTPAHTAHIRRADPRPFPFLALYASDNDLVVGQVGVFRLPMISTRGREDVGGVWAVSTHPQYAERGIASQLLNEAHNRMRSEGLRFSTLATNRFRVAYKLYLRHGYEDMGVLATAMAPWETAHQPTRLHASPLGQDGYEFVDKLFETIASGYLGFAWRYTPFIRLRDKVSCESIWILWKNEQAVGYALSQAGDEILHISNMVLAPGLDIAEAVAAVASKKKTAFVMMNISRPTEVSSLQRAGYQITNPCWDAFMVKPLTRDLTAGDARLLFGIGTDRFLISWLDTT
jgi:ribosomal protein S18 acetylase RimI-like enzyme